MRRINSILAAAVFTAFLISPVDAKYSGKELSNICSSGDVVEAAFCYGFVNGVVDTYMDFGYTLKTDQACFPEGVTGEQVIAVVIKYLQEHPEHWHYSASSNVMEAINKAFPCK